MSVFLVKIVFASLLTLAKKKKKLCFGSFKALHYDNLKSLPSSGWKQKHVNFFNVFCKIVNKVYSRYTIEDFFDAHSINEFLQKFLPLHVQILIY